jgi:hypothetical protein
MRTSPPSPLHLLVGRGPAANGSAAPGKAVAAFSSASYGSAAINRPWKRSLRRRSAAERLLGSWARIPPGGMDVCLL